MNGVGVSDSPSDHALPRKRVTLVEPSAASPPLHKKQRLSPQQGDDDEEEEGEVVVDKDLENFRKEAIWREMREYKRKFELAQRNVDQLQLERQRCEARLSAVDFSWNRLVQEADLLLPSTSTASNGHSHAALSPAVSDPSLTDEQLEEALAQRSKATKTLLSRLGALHPSSSTPSEKVEELEAKCASILDQSLRSQEGLRMLRAQHEATVLELEATHDELLRVQKRFDRLQSATVAKAEGRLAADAAPPAPDASTSAPQVNLPAANPASNGASPHTNGGSPAPVIVTATGQEMEEMRMLLANRDKDLEELRNDRVTLNRDLDMLKAKLVALPDEVVAESIPFRLVQGHVQHLQSEYEARRVELDRATKEADSLREAHESFKMTTFQEASTQVEEIQKRLTTKETDLTRIRADRENLRAETTELRAKDSDKLKQVEQLKTLAQSREDRIAAFESEVRRLKMDRAAAKGDSAGVDLHANNDEADIVNDLTLRLKTAEDLLLALQDQLRSYAASANAQDGATFADSEMAARKELSAAKSKLSSLEAILGPEGNVELRELKERVEEREKRLSVVEAQLKSQDQATNMLYGEIDRLSAAWSTLDEQNNLKVFNLVALEEKVQKLNVDKAKADNRYFATMRQKEALVAENSVLNKLAEKQQRTVETAEDVKHGLSVQLAAAEKEITLHQQKVRAYQETLAAARREVSDIALRNEQYTKQIGELTNILAERVAQAEAEVTSRKHFEEQLARTERELKLKTVKTSQLERGVDTSDVRKLKEHNEDLNKMLKCSTCMLRFKGVIINRCGHLFCKECIDARLANRQRKCPTCAVQFGTGDVSTVFF